MAKGVSIEIPPCPGFEPGSRRSHRFCAVPVASLFEEFDPIPYVSLLMAALMAHPIFLCLRYVRQNTAIRAAISKNHKRGSLN